MIEKPCTYQELKQMIASNQYNAMLLLGRGEQVATCNGMPAIEGPLSAAQAAQTMPNCGACPGDGSICKSACRLNEESPPAAQSVTPDMFWDASDPETFGHSVQVLLYDREAGEEVTIDCAKRLPSFRVRVTNDGDGDYEYVDDIGQPAGKGGAV